MSFWRVLGNILRGTRVQRGPRNVRTTQSYTQPMKYEVKDDPNFPAWQAKVGSTFGAFDCNEEYKTGVKKIENFILEDVKIYPENGCIYILTKNEAGQDVIFSHGESDPMYIVETIDGAPATGVFEGADLINYSLSYPNMKEEDIRHAFDLFGKPVAFIN